ncbi:MAG TPA: translation initiation factor [Myxococcaceae bacterium]|nr:translation initiation factor [Myxococcaceae bacterium]
MARQRKEVVSTGAAPFHQAFAGLEALKASLPAGQTPEPADTGRTSEGEAREQVPARAVVRRSRKGRGGREVTEISHLGLPSDVLATWIRELRTQLGCGGAVEEDVLVLHGDQRDRAEAWLKARGVRKITRG